MSFYQKITSISMILLAAFFLVAISTNDADARSSGGGRSFGGGFGGSSGSSFSSPAQRSAPAANTGAAAAGQRGGIAPGLAGGLLGGALGGMLLGSMFGAGGQGMGILPWLLLFGVGFLLYKRFKNQQNNAGERRQNSPFPIPPIGGVGGGAGNTGSSAFPGFGANQSDSAPSGAFGIEEGLAQIARHDRYFDRNHFLEVASDVFFQVQAGWMRRDLDSYRHLLGNQLAAEYAEHFQEMRQKGVINKLESIAIRQVDIVGAGSDGREDFVTVLFTANLLDYTVNDKTGELLEGSMTQPVKFAERWSWARPTGTDDWKLEGIEVAEG
jgi:predicted lipid-binding transport protein (Tim44 family)